MIIWMEVRLYEGLLLCILIIAPAGQVSDCENATFDSCVSQGSMLVDDDKEAKLAPHPLMGKR